MREIALTNDTGVHSHAAPLLAGGYGVVELQGLARVEFAFGTEDVYFLVRLGVVPRRAPRGLRNS